jgi:uncharacterized delta-60 repeat protein
MISDMKIQLLSVLTLLISLPLAAQTFSPDPTFGTGGMASFSHAKGTERIRALAVSGGGQLYSAGQSLRASTDFMLTRHLANGNPDPAFGTNGTTYVDFNGGTEELNSLSLQNDGKILLAGSSKGSSTQCALVRILPDGQPDAGFGANGKQLFREPLTSSFSQIGDVKVLGDGKVLVCGYYLLGNVYTGFLKRFLSNGTPDSSFGTNSVVTVKFSTATASNYAEKITLDANGNILVMGQYYVNRFLIGVARFSSSGVLDPAFSSDGMHTFGFTANGQNYTTGIHAQTDGKILVLGYANSTTANYKGFATRLLGDGSTDNAYGSNGIATMASGTGFNGIYHSALLSDNSLLVTGEALNQNFYRGTLFKLNASGQAAAGFGTNGLSFFSTTPASAFGNAVLPTNGGIWVAGAEYNASDNGYKSLVVAFSDNGQYLTNIGTAGRIYLTSSQPSTFGKVVLPTSNGYMVAGSLDNLDQDQFVARVTAGGQADPTFAASGLSKYDFGSQDDLQEMIELNDGSLVQLAQTGSVTLSFTGLGTFSNYPDYSLVRVNNNQGIQNTTQKKFRFSNTSFTRASRIRKDPQGRIVVLAYQTEPTRSAGFLQRHKANNLSLDSTFATNGSRSLYGLSFPNVQTVPDFLIDTANHYLVLNQFTAGSQTGFRLGKTTETFAAVSNFGNGGIIPGTFEVLDATSQFVTASRVFSIPNGFAILGSRNQIPTLFRINASGSTYTEIPLPGFKSLRKVIPQSDGSFLLAGINQSDRIELIRISAAGQLDNSFNTSGKLEVTLLNTPSVFRDAFTDAQGRLVVLAGNPQTDGSGEKMTLVRYALVTGVAEMAQKTDIQGFLFPNPGQDMVRWSAASSFQVQIFDAKGRQVQVPVFVSEGSALDVRHLPAGHYWFQLRSENHSATLPFVKP